MWACASGFIGTASYELERQVGALEEGSGGRPVRVRLSGLL
jgi:hypothetical protein